MKLWKRSHNGYLFDEQLDSLGIWGGRNYKAQVLLIRERNMFTNNGLNIINEKYYGILPNVFNEGFMI